MLPIYEIFVAQSIRAKCLNIQIHIYVTAKVRGTKICIKKSKMPHGIVHRSKHSLQTHTPQEIHIWQK